MHFSPLIHNAMHQYLLLPLLLLLQPASSLICRLTRCDVELQRMKPKSNNNQWKLCLSVCRDDSSVQLARTRAAILKENRDLEQFVQANLEAPEEKLVFLDKSRRIGKDDKDGDVAVATTTSWRHRYAQRIRDSKHNQPVHQRESFDVFFFSV